MSSKPSVAFVPVSIEMRDGAVLHGDVYLPKDDRKSRPVVLFRTPYGRRRPSTLKLCRLLAQRGFAVLAQDYRGRFTSEGEFLSCEGEDGLDTLAWMSEQEWCNGLVGLCGVSISSFSLLLLATLEPPPGIRIGAIVNLAGGGDIHSSFYPGGAMMLHWALPWCVMLHETWSRRPNAWQKVMKEENILSHIPLGEVGEKIPVIDLWQDLFLQAKYFEAWERFDLRPDLRKLEIPVLHFSGWYDNVLTSVMTAWRCLTSESENRSEQRLLIGPWDHQTLFFGMLGEKIKVGASKDEMASVNIHLPVTAWLRHWLESDADSAATETEAAETEAAETETAETEAAETETADSVSELEFPKVMLYVFGKAEWLGAEDYPLPETEYESWYLASDGRANSVAGNGRLVEEAPEQERSEEFVYDPENPVPSFGGGLWPLPVADLKAGAFDQREIEQREDVLVFTTAPLTEDKYVVGDLEVDLWISSSAPDTDFTAKLTEVDPEGVARIRQDGILRLRFADSESEERFLAPGEIRRITVAIGATACFFPAGYRMRLEISSSNFPKYDRNLNVAEPPSFASEIHVATQTVRHGGRYPSRLRVPVVDADSFERLRWELPPGWNID